MNDQINIECKKLMKLDDTMLIYGIYNAETLEKLINIVHEIHNVTSSHEKLFAVEHNPSLFRMLYTDALGIQQYATNLLLFLIIIQDKYISLYRELITQLLTYISAIRILAHGYLPNTLITPKKPQEILAEVKRSLQITNPDFTLVLNRLHLYYDMQLVTIGIDSDMNPVIPIPSMHSAIHSETFNFIPIGDSSSSYFGSKHQSSVLQTFENQKALYSFKLRNIHLTETTRTMIMEEDR